MRQDGFTLIEMLIVIAIISVLLSIATLSFNSMTRKSAVEGQTKMISADLMGVRSQALYEKRGRTVVVTTAQFTVYSSIGVGTTPLLVKALQVPVSPASLRMDFDQWGGATLNSDSTVTDASICAGANTDAALDSVVISRSSIQTGKLNSAECASANIDVK